MDIQISNLQKIYGKTPINLNSRAIDFVSKKTRNTVLVTGAIVVLASVAYCFYKLGKKRAEHELALTKRKLEQLNSLSYNATNSVSKKTEFQDIRKVATVPTPKKDEEYEAKIASKKVKN
jgi:hypothetical protein